ncbi:MAG TPA: 2-phosphosulfolactate phosphatase [Pirellulales bacterium]|jgi:2-phosphosulfolactate phosphatase|nr:2-phosphosulfolactate phosphatase [Pirellulales bacterium]
MYSTLSVHFLPALTTPEELAAGVVVVIDVLRATTTITTALAAGAREVIACAEVEQARHKAAELGRHRQASAKALVAAAAELSGATATTVAPAIHSAKSEPLLGGERGGLPIDGFDLGNSPCEYTPQVVAGRTIVFTTTNGTQALVACSTSRRVLIGSFVNFSAVLNELTGDLPMHLLCAGTRGRITREDVLFAGSLVEQLAGRIVEEEALNDEARIARDVWRQAMGKVRPPDRRANQRLVEVLKETQGGSNLLGVGLARDIADAAQVDRYDFVPVFDPDGWRIVRSPS